MSDPISPSPVLGSGTQELPAYVANGLLGLRTRDMPLSSGMALISGFTGEHPERQIEAAAVAPYPVAADLALDGVWLSDVPHQVSDLQQAYDFSAGELTTRFTFEAAGRAAHVEVVIFCSRHDPTLVCQEISVTVDKACALGLRAIVDAAGVDGRALKHARTTPGEDKPVIDGTLLWESAGAFSKCGVALVTELLGAGEQEAARPPLQYDRLVTEYGFRARAARAVRLRQIASVIPDVMHQMPDQHAARLAAKARKDGFDKVRKQNRAVWDELWKGRIRLEGAGERWQSLADAAFFYLNSSVHPASPASTSIFGLATWRDYHYYYGHVMWDIEAFAVPALCMLQPDAAAALLGYVWRAPSSTPACGAAVACNFRGRVRREAARRRPRYPAPRPGTKIMSPWTWRTPLPSMPTSPVTRNFFAPKRGRYCRACPNGSPHECPKRATATPSQNPWA